MGAATALADASVGFGPAERQWVRVFVVVLNLATTWALAAFISGRVMRTLRSGALGGLVALWLAVAGYYLFGVTLGDRTDVGWQALLRPAAMWLLVASAVGPVFGSLGAASTRPRWWAPMAAPLPLLALLEVFGRIGWSVEDLTGDPALGWTLLSVVVLAGASLIVLVATTALAGRPRMKPAGRGDQRAE